MSSDKEKLIEMLTRAKIEYVWDAEDNTLTVEAGYIGFVTIFNFNPDESLLKMGAYE